MVTDEAKRRARILSFWKKYGLAATREAFGVGRSTLFVWQARQRAGDGGFESLNPASRRPKTFRRSSFSPEVVSEIRRIRTAHPNLGKEKVHALLAPFCARRGVLFPSIATIGRIIAAASDKMRTFPTKVRHDGRIVSRKRQKRVRKPKQFIATHPGHCLAFDTVERIIHGSRRYIVTGTDLYSRFSFAFATRSHASAAATQFFRAIQQLFPHPIQHILTDNGSEFMKHFDEEVRRLHKTHWHTYPKTPKMNAHCERFNRTIQEEFVDYHAPELLNPASFNRKLAAYLSWYNGERPHWSLGLKSPVQYLIENHPESRMWWTDT